jgi:hypothetical protein
LRSVGAKSYSTIVDRFTKKKMKEIFELRRMNFWQTKRQTSITVWQKLKKLKKYF